MASILTANIEVSSDRSINKGLPEWLISALLVGAVAAIEALVRTFTDTEVVTQLPAGVAPIIALVLQNAAQYIRRRIRDKVKIDSQV